MQSLTGKPVPKSYWTYALEYCSLELDEVIPSRFRRIDHYWRRTGAMMNDSGNGKAKYVQLYQLAIFVVCVSHVTAVSECSFSINKKLLETHGKSIQEETIVVIR